MAPSNLLNLFCNSHARHPSPDAPDTTFASPEAVQTVRRFHYTMPAYQPTPLVALDQLAHTLGVSGIWVKDESKRFGLKAFKGLGASYAVCATLAEHLDIPSPLSFVDFKQPDIRKALSKCTLMTASDGNHGMAVAWMASQLGCHSRVLLPRGTAACRLDAIHTVGGEAIIVHGNYDDAVRRAAREADEREGILIQDTAWEGYEVIPRRIMQGYLTLFDEAFEQMGDTCPTHIFVPCGVGALAASLQAFLVEKFAGRRPIMVVIEAAAADCYYRSMVAGGQAIIPVRGNLTTRMAGLACGEPTRPGWEILRRYTDGFASCHDALAIKGMQRLAVSLTPDPPIESGECGAVPMGCLCHLMLSETQQDWQTQLDLGPRSRILLFSTEGATDPESYRQAIRHLPDNTPAGD
jgi:diaminopropionate ammonia-lyase